MTNTVPTGVFSVRHEIDPAQEIRDSIGDISSVRLGPGRVLVAIYKRPEKTSGGIIRTIGNQTEDVYQGKAWLVLAMGPKCFEDSEQGTYGGFKAEVGDWVLARNNDGWRCDIGGEGCKNGYECLVINDRYIKGVISTPSMVW